MYKKNWIWGFSVYSRNPKMMVASSRFRYSAPLVPWPDAELNRLHLKWIGLAKVA